MVHSAKVTGQWQEIVHIGKWPPCIASVQTHHNKNLPLIHQLDMINVYTIRKWQMCRITFWLKSDIFKSATPIKWWHNGAKDTQALHQGQSSTKVFINSLTYICVYQFLWAYKALYFETKACDVLSSNGLVRTLDCFCYALVFPFRCLHLNNFKFISVDFSLTKIDCIRHVKCFIGYYIWRLTAE